MEGQSSVVVRKIARVVVAVVLAFVALSGGVARAFDPPPGCIHSSTEDGFAFTDCPMVCNGVEWYCTEFCLNDDADFSACKVFDLCGWWTGTDFTCSYFPNESYGSCTCKRAPGGGG